MKLLLTSAGITNQSIARALFDLVDKKPEDTNIVFIPTAANVVDGDKTWLTEDINNLKKLNLESLEVVDIVSQDKNIWLPKIKKSDVIFFGGGYTYYLMEQLNKTGLAKLLPELLKNKVYAGISAGSMVTNKNLQLNISQIIYEEDLDKDYEMPGLNLVDFYFLPHLNSSDFSKVEENYIKQVIKDQQNKYYVLDDNSAVKIIDDKVEVVSEGKWFLIN